MKMPQTVKIVLLLIALLPQSLLSVAQTLEVLTSFNGTNGKYPTAALTLGNDGNFYGTTLSGSTNNLGTVFKVTTNGTLTTLVSFNNMNGGYQYAALTLGNDGNFYGTTQDGGNNYGTLFKVTPNGTFTTLVSFNWTNGAKPCNALTLADDGSFYGTTQTGGSKGYGTIFHVTTNGALTSLFSFDITNGLNEYGEYINAMPLGNDGHLYGTTFVGGNNNCGTLFKVTTNGTFTTLIYFNNANGTYTNELNPNSLILGNDGNLYGTASAGGSGYCGTVFVVTTNSKLTTLVSFNNTNGANPISLMIGKNGNFYGTTYGGGTYGDGTIFRLTTNGVFTTLASLDGTNGWTPEGLTEGNDGNLYGTAYGGGSGGCGTIFRLSIAPCPPIISVQLIGGQPMLLLNGLLGNNFTVEYSTNLACTNWMNLLSITNLSANPYHFIDPALNCEQSRFYRAIMQ